MCSAPFLRALVCLSAPSLLGRREPTRLSNQVYGWWNGDGASPVCTRASTEDSSFFNSSSAWAKVRSEGTRLKPVKVSVELMERLLNRRIFPVKFTLMLEISQ